MRDRRRKHKMVGNKDYSISVEGRGMGVKKMVLQGLSGRKTGNLKEVD